MVVKLCYSYDLDHTGITIGDRYLTLTASEFIQAVLYKKDTKMTATMQVEIENLKCGGCEKSILKGLATMEGISEVSVDHDLKLVSFNGDQSVRSAVVTKLRSMGYPEKDSLRGLDAGLANAKSFVSCAIGRVT